MASKKAKGKRAHTRDKFKKRGSKATVNKLLQEIPIGTKIDIKIPIITIAPTITAG